MEVSDWMCWRWWRNWADGGGVAGKTKDPENAGAVEKIVQDVAVAAGGSSGRRLEMDRQRWRMESGPREAITPIDRPGIAKGVMNQSPASEPAGVMRKRGNQPQKTKGGAKWFGSQSAARRD